MKQFTEREIAKAFRVPLWVIGREPKPSWWRHPLRRIQGWWWSRA